MGGKNKDDDTGFGGIFASVKRHEFDMKFVNRQRGNLGAERGGQGRQLRKKRAAMAPILTKANRVLENRITSPFEPDDN